MQHSIIGKIMSIIGGSLFIIRGNYMAVFARAIIVHMFMLHQMIKSNYVAILFVVTKLN